MFGYLTLDPSQLDRSQRRVYRQFYCGLCHVLNEEYGLTGRKSLSYDLTFISVLLTSVNELTVTENQETCPLHPIVRHGYLTSECMEFTAAMNVLLYYYKCLDDWKDEHSQKAFRKAQQLQEAVEKIEGLYPQHCRIIREKLDDIAELEKHNCLNPDLPANCFGLLMAEVFDYGHSDKADTLKAFGYHIGRFIYLMDARMDLTDDIRKQLYNPLVAMDLTDYKEMLEMVMADAVAELEKLNITSYRAIIDNVLYSGIWLKYRVKYRERSSGDERSL